MSSLEINAIYMTLSCRGTPGIFHVGILVMSLAKEGTYYHVNNESGGWFRKVETSFDPKSSSKIALYYKLGTVSSQVDADQVLRATRVDGSASLRTGEAFNSNTWTKDAVVALEGEGIVKLSADIDILGQRAIAKACDYENRIERGKGQAAVKDSI